MIPLVNTKAVVENKKKKSFIILTQTDNYFLSATREKEMNHWIYSVNKHAKWSQGRLKSGKSVLRYRKSRSRDVKRRGRRC